MGGVFSQLGFFVDGTSSTDFGALRSGGAFSHWDFFVDGTSSPDLGALRWGEYFHNWDFSQTELPPSISALSDWGSIFTVGFFFTVAFFRRRDFLHRSRRSQIGGVFSQLGFFVDGTSSTDLGALRSGEYFHSLDIA